ncbi:hypothetical protein [Aurantimonas sp. VKM B-3413]|uniref:hypothetical protein n=1 Tax=Aurantimonas sp. VKM B-3413 TaxID=2779401 RepID=UPI001E2A0B99|nr:hypothetical protein [Aurantimonas sp. VKM B-3413]MCB8840155.1 hypothetical protein [Aurantimonas sp. VKM B-3413]
MHPCVIRTAIAILSLLSWMAPASVASQERPVSDFTDWANGQLIFEDDGRAISKALRAATGRPYTHVGMVRITGGGAVALDTNPSLWENFVEEFIAKAVSGRYAVYALRGLSTNAAFTPPRVANGYLNTPDDPYLRPGRSELSGVELARLSFAALGIKLGKTTTFGGLAVKTPAIRDWFHGVWRNHPDCKVRHASETACWDIVRRQSVITPASLAEDPHLVCVWSNFEADRNLCPGPR